MFSDKQKLREFVTTKTCSREASKVKWKDPRQYLKGILRNKNFSNSKYMGNNKSDVIKMICNCP